LRAVASACVASFHASLAPSRTWTLTSG
jgi:hypothetical protein